MGTGYSRPKPYRIIEIQIDDYGTLLSQTNVVLLIEYDVLAIMYYELIKYIKMCTAYFFWI